MANLMKHSLLKKLSYTYTSKTEISSMSSHLVYYAKKALTRSTIDVDFEVDNNSVLISKAVGHILFPKIYKTF